MFGHHISENESLLFLEERHAEELFVQVERNREQLRRWMPWLDGARTVEDTRKYIRRVWQDWADRKELGAGIMVDGRIVGCVSLHSTSKEHRKCAVGYWLSTEAQGRGTMTRATHAMVRYAFEDLNFNRVEIRCAVDNVRSRAIPARLGFALEGTLREAEWLYDHFVDWAMYAMLQKDWRTLRAANPT